MKLYDQCGQWLANGLCGFIPIYGENGVNGSTLLFNGGPPLYNKRKVKSILFELARHFQKDLMMVRNYSYELTGLKHMSPMALADGVLLIPVKIREPIGKNDGSIGYIWETAVREVASSNRFSALILKDGTRIETLERTVTLNRRVKAAHTISKEMAQRLVNSNPANIAINEVRDAYNQPATKGDIALLSQSILTLINRIH